MNQFDLIVIGVLILGFIFGCIKGKWASFFTFIGTGALVVLCYLFAEQIYTSVSSVKLNYSGEGGLITLNDYLNNLISSNDVLNDILGVESGLQEIFFGLFKSLFKLMIVTGLTILIIFIVSPILNMLYAVLFKHFIPSPFRRRKSRFIGGIFGAAQMSILVLSFMVLFSGSAPIIIAAQERSIVKPILSEKFVDSYSNSKIVKAVNPFALDLFDNLTEFTVDDEKYHFRDEALAIIDIYDDNFQALIKGTQNIYTLSPKVVSELLVHIEEAKNHSIVIKKAAPVAIKSAIKFGVANFDDELSSEITESVSSIDWDNINYATEGKAFEVAMTLIQEFNEIANGDQKFSQIESLLSLSNGIYEVASEAVLAPSLMKIALKDNYDINLEDLATIGDSVSEVLNIINNPHNSEEILNVIDLINNNDVLLNLMITSNSTIIVSSEEKALITSYINSSNFSDEIKDKLEKIFVINRF